MYSGGSLDSAAGTITASDIVRMSICPVIYEYPTFFPEEMLNEEQESLRERVADLEIKVLEQAEELTCLRTTIADLTRRLTQVEGRGKC